MTTTLQAPATDDSILQITDRQLSRRRLFRTAGTVAAVSLAAAGVGAGRWILTPTTAGTATGAARAAAGTKPDASNTGVIPGSTLTPHDGDLIITAAGTTINNLDIAGNVTIKASNVTISNCIIRGAAIAPNTGSYALIMQYSNSYTNIVIQDCTLLAQSPNQWTSGIQGSGFTVRRCDISNTVDGIDAAGAGNVLVDSCYIHDGCYFTPSATHTDNQTHDDGIQITNGNNIAFTNNTITNFAMSCFMVGQDQGVITNLTISDNWLDGGTATINLNSKGRATLNPVITNNRFGRSRKNTYLILTAGSVSTTNITGNVYDDNNQPVKITVS